MYLRFVRLQVKEGAEAKLAEFYRERVIPALAATPGCRFAGLLRPWRGADHQSLTIWDSPSAAESYEDGGLYHRLLRECEPLLSSSTRWRVRLGDDPLATLDPGRREIPPEGYVLAGDGDAGRAGEGRAVYVRMVSIRVDPERQGQFSELYAREVVPALEALDGCRGVFLAAGALTPNSVLSISFWEREEDALRYEMSGEFERLTAKLQDTFAPTYAWKLVLGAGHDTRSVAPKVESYHLVQAQKLGGA